MSTPKLIETTTYSLLSNSLQNCHNTRIMSYSFLLNIGILVVFLGVTITILYVCYKCKKTPKEVQEKMMREQEYIVSKIREYKHQQRMISGQKSITGLPATIEKPFH